jgi:hypothetical protein
MWTLLSGMYGWLVFVSLTTCGCEAPVGSFPEDI